MSESPSYAITSAVAPDAGSVASQRSAALGSLCFHCGTASTQDTHWSAVVDGAKRSFCCACCLAIAQTIRAAGLTDFYVQRPRPAERAGSAEDWRTYDAGGESSGWTVRIDPHLRETSLLLEGIQCAACLWLVEAYLKRQKGVATVSVNLAPRRACIRWDERETRLSALLGAVAAIGYRAYPYDPARREVLARRESRSLLTRTAVAVLAMMQVMMFAGLAYVTVDGVEPEFQSLLGWASLVLTLPVVAYSAAPFFRGALRDSRLRQAGMDVPVALGVGGAFIASARATLTGTATAYYDSVTMFVALLLCARYVELRLRQRALALDPQKQLRIDRLRAGIAAPQTSCHRGEQK